MIKIKIAELTVKLNNKYAFTEEFCRAYAVPDSEKEDFSVTVSDGDTYTEMRQSGVDSAPLAECSCLYRAICLEMLKYDTFLLHSACVEENGSAYAFAAEPGTGKTTHLKLWMKSHPDIRVINGDKPLVKYKDGCFTVYGTPWNGKENYGENISAPLKAICFIERSDTVSIYEENGGELTKKLMRQLLLPKHPELMLKQLELADKLVKNVKFYTLKCNVSNEAARLSYETMTAFGAH